MLKIKDNLFNKNQIRCIQQIYFQEKSCDGLYIEYIEKALIDGRYKEIIEYIIQRRKEIEQGSDSNENN